MGPAPEDRLYDVARALPDGVAALAGEMAEVIRHYGPLGAPLWPPVASSAYAALLSGEERSLFCALTWDASPVGWAGLARWWDHSGREPVLRDLLLLGSWPADWDVSQQPFREALGGALAFEAFTQTVHIGGLTCVLRNDAAAAVAAFRKGSTQSPQMQRCALRLDRAAALVDVDCLPLHVPGLTLVAEGIDGASRGGAEFGEGVNVEAILGPAVSDALWATVVQAATDAGWGAVTVDAFATASNARRRGPRASGAGLRNRAPRRSTHCASPTGPGASAPRAAAATARSSTPSRRTLWCGPRSRRPAPIGPCASSWCRSPSSRRTGMPCLRPLSSPDASHASTVSSGSATCRAPSRGPGPVRRRSSPSSRATSASWPRGLGCRCSRRARARSPCGVAPCAAAPRMRTTGSACARPSAPSATGPGPRGAARRIRAWSIEVRTVWLLRVGIPYCVGVFPCTYGTTMGWPSRSGPAGRPVSACAPRRGRGTCPRLAARASPLRAPGLCARAGLSEPLT